MIGFAPPRQRHSNLAMTQIRFSAFVFAVLLTTAIARAGDSAEPKRIEPVSTAPTAITIASQGQVQATPDMWFYQQELARYNEPNSKALVRAAAQEKAAQRRARIAAMQWYGYSNSRPTAGIDPVNGPISPQWVGNGYNSYYWVQPSIWVLPGMARGY